MRRYNLNNGTIPTVRVVVLGGQNVGKSALVVRFLTKRFIGEYVSGTEITYQQEVNLAGNKVTAEICDALIKKEHQAQLKRLSSNTEGYILVYNICNRESFDYVRQLAHKVKASHYNLSSGNDVPLLLVGNKSDLDHFREVKKSEGEAFAKSLTRCHFVETSAAESYTEVEHAFRLIFQLVRAQIQTSPTSSVSSGKHIRKNSLSQVALLIRDHCRRQHAAAGNYNRTNSLERGISLIKKQSAFFDNNNNSTLDSPPRRRSRKSAVTSVQSNYSTSVVNAKSKLASKCLSLNKLNENPNATPVSNSTIQNPVRNNMYHHQRYFTIDSGMSTKFLSDEFWQNNEFPSESSSAVMTMSLSSDDALELSDLSTPDEDAFLPDTNVSKSNNTQMYYTSCNNTEQQQNSENTRRSNLSNKNEPSQRTTKSNFNKKGLHISVHSDGEYEEKESNNADEVPPKSAPLLHSSSNSKFRYFPNSILEKQDNLKHSWSSLSNSSVPISPLLEKGRCSRRKSFKDDKRSPSHSFLKQFFKGALYGSNTGSKCFLGSNQNLSNQISSSSSEASLPTLPECCKNELFSINEHHCQEDGFDCDRPLCFQTSSTSLSSITNSDSKAVEEKNIPISAPCSPRVRKSSIAAVLSRRPSIREAVGELVRKRKKSKVTECFNHRKEQVL